MSGLTGLVDTLLAAKLSPRLEVAAIKAAVEIAGPGPVLEVQKVSNDVRLPSNAALDRLIPDDGAAPAPPPAGAPAPATQLSIAARVIGVLLAELDTDTPPPPVRGTQPMWPASPATASSVALAGTLAQTVSASGLFYESHLADFAAGTRSLAQLSLEPQAQWALPAAATGAPVSAASSVPVALPLPAGAGAGAPQATEWQGAVALQAGARMADAELPLPGAAATGAPMPNSPPLAAAAEAVAAIIANSGEQADAMLAMPAKTANAAGTANATAAPASSADPAARPDAVSHADATRVQAAYRWSDAPAPASLLRSDAVAADAVSRTADAARPAHAAVPPPVEPLQPQAAALVHQQLDLLATAVFRWSGEAWPGVPMEWSIHEEAQDGGRADALDEEQPRRWATRIALDLPRLGAVDLRLSVAGPAVQARLAANDALTMARLRADGAALAHRLGAVGLQLGELRVTAGEAS